jgi:hypothetical protein
MGGVNSSIGIVCTAVLTKKGASFVSMQGSVLILGDPAGSYVSVVAGSCVTAMVGSCVTAGSSFLTTKVEGVGGAPDTRT